MSIGHFSSASGIIVSDTRVGDTITGVENPAAEPLPGYRPVQPMVYSGIYPADGARYQDLRDALEKLKLNDAAFVYEPESSIALACCKLDYSSAAGAGLGALGFAGFFGGVTGFGERKMDIFLPSSFGALSSTAISAHLSA